MEDKFIELITKELSGQISPDERAELQAFLNKNVAYASQYNSFKIYWENKDAEHAGDAFSFQKVKAKILKHESLNVCEAADNQRDHKTPLFAFWRSIAAVLIIGTCVLLAYLQYYSHYNDNAAVTYHQKTTAKRAKSTIILSDGTYITLNSGSTLKYPSEFAGKTREVYLIGEAFFTVHKDHEHPFIIHTGKMSIKVLGTEFNVRSYPAETLTETSLIRGSIEVTLADRPSDHIILKPKEKLIVKNNTFKVEAPKKDMIVRAPANPTTQYTLTSITYLNHVDTAVVETSWLKNKLVANNEEFINLAQKMNRFYGVDIHFTNHDIEKLRFTATFEKENIKEALNSMKLIEKFNYKIDKANNIYIY